MKAVKCIKCIVVVGMYGIAEKYVEAICVLNGLRI